MIEAFAMWGAMMAAMMLPGALPAVPWRAPASAARFLAGYLAVWAAFAVAAALLQLALESAHLLTEDMALRNRVAAGLTLVVIGLYQLTPWKRSCLRATRAPGIGGLRYGAACLGCSGALMGVLFVAGVMNLFAIVAVAVWVAVEKTFPWGTRLAPVAAGGMILWGGVTLFVR